MLSRYVTETQLLLNDPDAQFYRVPTIQNYVNRSRRRIAYASECIRSLPIGTRTFPNQEVYNFSDWVSLIQGDVAGSDSILHCRSLAISVGMGPSTWKPMWRRIPWTDFQARFRIYHGTFYGTISEPGWWAQFGSGPAGKIYLAPIPSQENLMEVDLTLIPAPLISDESPEPIPYPWTDAVCYWAACLALMQQQRTQDVQGMIQLFAAELPQCAAVVCPQFVQSPYGAARRSA